MKIVFLIGFVLAFLGCESGARQDGEQMLLIQEEIGISLTTDKEMARYYDQAISDQQVYLQGEVSKILADDNDGSRHQRFILRLASGQTILVAHNIDLAQRISGLQMNDQVAVYGEYEWNDRGGVVHWTHHDPQNQHVYGWVSHKGQKFQ